MRRLGRAGLLALVPTAALAHGGLEHGAEQGASLWTTWSFESGVTIPLALAVGIYYGGLYRLWRRAGAGRGIPRWRAAAFAGGLLTLFIALCSPLDAIAGQLFSAHMVQHLLLILVAPPLLVIGMPDVALLWSLPVGWRTAGGRIERALGDYLRGESGAGKGPLVIVVLAIGVLWAWHVPALYDLAVRNEDVHYAEHAGFLITSLLFWAAVLRLRPRDHLDNGLRILYVFAMAIQGSLLGALLTFASRPLYAAHAHIPARWHLSQLVDQQIAGLIMWIPPAVLYVGVTAYLFVSWLKAAGQVTHERSSGYPRMKRENQAEGVDDPTGAAIAPHRTRLEARD